MKKLPYVFRLNTPDDRNYILRSWLKTWRDEPINSKLPTSVYYAEANPLFGNILERFGAIVVCNPNDFNQIYGFAVCAFIPVAEEWILFWLQVKAQYSRLGIGKALFNYLNFGFKGPICPFVRDKLRNLIGELNIIDNPYILNMISEMSDLKSAEYKLI